MRRGRGGRDELELLRHSENCTPVQRVGGEGERYCIATPCVSSEAWGCTLLTTTYQVLGTLGNSVDASLTHEYFFSCTFSEQRLGGSIVKAENYWCLWKVTFQWRHHLLIFCKTINLLCAAVQTFKGAWIQQEGVKIKESLLIYCLILFSFCHWTAARNQPFCLSLEGIFDNMNSLLHPILKNICLSSLLVKILWKIILRTVHWDKG